MRLNRNELSKAVHTALLLGAVATLGVAGTAFAQTTTNNAQDTQQTAQQQTKNGEQQAKTLSTVVVTGSHIRRVDLETDNPVVTVTAQDIAKTGALTLGEVIKRLPVITGGINTPIINNGGGSGSTTVGLRGLGAARTLVLVDGQRIINKDLNTIPVAAIKTIQVLTSGASAIYGSDAIGGVINIILKDHYQGAQVSVNYGISDHSDGQRKGVSFMFGQVTDKGSILAGVSYQKYDSILQSSRDFSINALSTNGTVNGEPAFTIGGSTFALRDFVSVGGALATKFGCPTSAKAAQLSLNPSAFKGGTSPTAAGDYHCFGSQPGDKYNYSAVNYLMTPNERTNVFFKGDYHLAENVDLYATFYHNKTSSGFQLAPAVFGTATVGGLTISKDSYYNPFGVDFSPTSGALYRSRLKPAGNRAAKNGNTTDQLIMGVRGNLDILNRNWQWDVGYNYGHISTVRTLLGLPNQNNILPGLTNPSMLDPATGNVVCVKTPGDLSTVIPGCTPWDPFNLNSASAKAVLSGAAAPGLENFYNIQRDYHAGVNGGLFDLPAGTMRLALGINYRKQYTNNTIDPVLVLDPATGSCVLGSQCSAHLQGGFSVKEAYGELFVPVLRGLPGVYSLNLTLSDRYSKYSTFGSTNNWKIGMEYRPTGDLLLRGTVSEVFRAPTIGDVFGAPVSSAPFLSSDPCDGITTAGNPACKGVPTDGTFKDNKTPNVQQLQALNEGSKAAGFPLGPETGKSFDFGVVYSPHYVQGLSMTADFWRIYLNNTITSVGVQSVLNLCFAGVTDFCPLITRAQSGPNAGQIIRMVQPTANLGRVDVSGTDVSAKYQLPAFSFGQFNVSVNATYLNQLKIQTAPGTPGNAVVNGAGLMGWFGSTLQAVCPFSAGGMCFFPRVRGRAVFDWKWDHWHAAWTTRYTSPFRMAGAPRNGVEGLDQFPSYVYNDLMVGYDIDAINTSIQVGVNNVSDKKPPILGANRSLNANTDPEDFDTIGRYYWARLTVRF